MLVAGATGALGQELVRECKGRGYAVRALGRDRSKLARLEKTADEIVTADALKPERLQGACDCVDAVISCLGASVIPELKYGRATFTRVDYPANCNLIQEAERAGVKRFVYISTFGAERLGRFDFVRGHEQVVEELRKSPMEYSVLRCTGFHSSMHTILNIGGRIAVPEHNGGTARTNPIHESDLARLCVDALEAPPGERDVGGPEGLTRKQIAELVLAGRKYRRVPSNALRMGSLALKFINPRVSNLYAFIAEILEEDVLAPLCGSITMADYCREREALQTRLHCADNYDRISASRRDG